MSISNLGLSSSDDGNAERTIKKGQKRTRYLPENSEGWSAKSRYKLEYWRLVNRASFLLFASRMQPDFSVSVPFCSTRNLFMGLSGLVKTSDVFWRNNNKRPVASSSVVEIPATPAHYTRKLLIEKQAMLFTHKAMPTVFSWFKYHNDLRRDSPRLSRSRLTFHSLLIHREVKEREKNKQKQNAANRALSRLARRKF